ncbi:MAG: sigma-70 family RNA polymerase sigma factor [Bacteroidota bacterium]|nr:sigma-70 family RNA polymerase sigma factor [Bacteroidota bacterium]
MAFFPRKKKSVLSDEDLLRAYRASGDKTLVGELYIRYSHLVYGLCLNYFRDREIARDAVLVLFEKLFESLKKNQPENFKLWLTFVARNHCISELRKQKTNNERAEEYLREDEYAIIVDPENPQKEDAEKREEKLKKLEAAVTSLGDEQRKCVELFYFKDKSYQEISRLTGFTEKQVKSHLQNGKRNLKQYLEEEK